ncbi:MAG: 50S ribosomal protein L5 [Sulfolobales archaeon]
MINKWKKNPMTIPYIAKVTVNISTGESGEKLMKAMKLLEQITGAKPVPRRAKKTIREFNVKRGENIATIVTLRGEAADNFLRRVFQGIGGRVNEKAFDPYGNVSLGIREHLIIPGTRYDPEIGIFGMDIAITLEKKGYRVSKRRRKRSRIPRRHRVSREEAMLLLTLKYNISIIPSSR